MDIAAALVHPGSTEFTIETVQLDSPRPDEILVKIVAVGICHSDVIATTGIMAPLPAVFGHEGAGIVSAVGSEVTRFQPGDPVLLSFASCGTCPHCQSARPASCRSFDQLNLAGRRADGSATISQTGKPVSSAFFGQSSFASHALVQERNAVKLAPGDPLDLFAPLGCGIQTGAGAILKSLDCAKGTSVLITGGGSVGLSAVMAAAIRGCSPIIVSEPNAGRRALALELGASHAIDPVAASLAESLAKLMPHGIDHAFDTTGRVDVIDVALGALANSGVVCLAGVPEGDVTALTIPIRSLMSGGKSIRGTVEGDSNPQEFIPELIGYYRAGQLPLEKLVKFYAFADINKAVADQKAGLCLKPVLRLCQADGHQTR